MRTLLYIYENTKIINVYILHILYIIIIYIFKGLLIPYLIIKFLNNS